MHLSPTGFSRLRECEYRWFAGSVLRIEPRGAARHYLDRGNLFHALLERAFRIYVETGEVYTYEGEHGFRTARDVFVEQYRSPRAIQCDEPTALELLEAIRWHMPRLGLHEWEIVELDGEPLIEKKLQAPWGRHELHAVLDLVFQHRTTGLVWHVNWKTSAKDLKPRTHVVGDYQLFLERLILEHHGIKPDVSALCYLRSKAPTPPTLIHKGRDVSRNKQALSCTWEMYAEVVRSLGKDPDDYADLQPVLDAKLFSRWVTDAAPPIVHARMRADLTAWLDRAAALHDGWNNRLRLVDDAGDTASPSAEVPRRRLDRACESCDYALWCRAGVVHPEGMDVELLSTDYRIRDERSPLVGLRKFGQATTFDPAAAYKQFGARFGRPNIEPHQEFKP